METEGARLAPLALDDPTEIGAFRLIGRLGSGGMGVVYFGRDASGYPAAIKMVRAEYASDPGYRSRFAREVDLARRVHGRCIAPLLAAGPEDDRPWLAVAYVPGPTLRSYLAEHGPLRGTDLTAFAAGMAEALAVVHREGIVHRDLKPENVILSPEGPKVLDFGIAQALDEVSMTRADMVVGTPGWISPERYEGHRAGPASDMFCWGGLVANAASGRQPYGTGPVEVLRYRTVNEDPDSAAAELPDALHDVVLRALDRDPERRPTAAEAFAAITGESVPDTGAAGQDHLTRVATRMIDANWTVAVDDASARFPAEPLRATTAQRPITFAGASVHRPAELAELLRRHDNRAENWLIGDGAAKLRDWLDDIGDTAYDRDYLARIATIEQAAVAITAFTTRYLPATPPVYRGSEVGIEGLRRLAAGTPQDHQLLSEAILNEIPLIAAGHQCRHPGCTGRCARLERVGTQTRSVVDAALTAAGRIGLRPAPTERDRAVAITVETIDESTRNDALHAVLRAWSALPVPWWRPVARRALRADPATGPGRSDLVLARLAAPYARTAAPHAWRRLIRPSTWVGQGAPRVFLLAFLLWCTAATAWSGILSAGGTIGGRHPAHPGATHYGALIAAQVDLWPLFLLMALGLALLPARRRAGAVLYGTLLALTYGWLANLAPLGPFPAPHALRAPLVDAVSALGATGWVAALLPGIAAPILFIWLMSALPPDPAPYRYARPLLAQSNAIARAVTAIAGLGLVMWLPFLSWLLLLLTLGPKVGLVATRTEAAEGFGLFLGVLLPCSLALGALAYLLWRRIGGHALYLGVILQLVLLSTVLDGVSPKDFAALGGPAADLARDNAGAAVTIAAVLLLPGCYGLGVWLSERLRYRRPPPQRPAGYPRPGYGPPVPGYGPPAPYGPPSHGHGMPGYAPMPPRQAAPGPMYPPPHPQRPTAGPAPSPGTAYPPPHGAPYGYPGTSGPGRGRPQPPAGTGPPGPYPAPSGPPPTRVRPEPEPEPRTRVEPGEDPPTRVQPGDGQRTRVEPGEAPPQGTVAETRHGGAPGPGA